MGIITADALSLVGKPESLTIIRIAKIPGWLPITATRTTKVYSMGVK
jgi:hypothetical protein